MRVLGRLLCTDSAGSPTPRFLTSCFINLTSIALLPSSMLLKCEKGRCSTVTSALMMKALARWIFASSEYGKLFWKEPRSSSSALSIPGASGFLEPALIKRSLVNSMPMSSRIGKTRSGGVSLAPKTKLSQSGAAIITGCVETCRTRRCVGTKTCPPGSGCRRCPNNLNNVARPAWPLDTTATLAPCGMIRFTSRNSGFAGLW
mmetsp:Transcript_24925/g.62469  ORF Transcript_24925/g.62469 Transcript_24925/m.62469 type:complete len:203 (+) Transcript_24925:176-784(+)